MDEMELKRKKSWIKHYDFILADFIVLQISHILANLIRYRTSSYGGMGYAFNLPIFKNEVIFLTVCLVASITFGDPYKNVLKNSKYVEFVKTFKHTLKMAMVNIVIIYFSQLGNDSSRYVLHIYIATCLGKATVATLLLLFKSSTVIL